MGISSGNPLPYRVLITEDADSLYRRLQKILDGLYTDADTEKELKNQLLFLEYQHIYELLRGSFSKDSIKEIILKIQEAIKDLPVIEIQLAFYPSQAFAEELVKWMDLHGPGFGKLDIKINPGIIAGIVIGYKGKIYEYTIANKVSA